MKIMNIFRSLILVAIAITAFAATAQKSIVQRKCWLDGNIAASQSLAEGPVSIDISSLKAGLHSFAIRVQDSDGKWSSSVTRFFLKPAAPSEATIVRCMYWFDGDIQHAVTAPLEGNNGVISVDVIELAAGEHTLSWIVGDDKGAWSEVTTEIVYIPYHDGDVNHDNEINITDVTALISSVLNDDPSVINVESADFNGDGNVNISDIVALINYILNN